MDISFSDSDFFDLIMFYCDWIKLLNHECKELKIKLPCSKETLKKLEKKLLDAPTETDERGR